MYRRKENEWLQEESEKTKLESVSQTEGGGGLEAQKQQSVLYAALRLNNCVLIVFRFPARLSDICVSQSQEAR